MNEKLLRHFHEIEKIHWWWEGRRQILRQSLEKKPGLKILDIGCGTGETLTFLEGCLDKPKLYGIDNMPVAIDFARKRGHKNIRLVDAKKLPFNANSFDYVLLLDVIEHIEDDSGILLEAKRVLKKGGKIIITTPALQFIWSEHDSEQGHFRRYTRSRMRWLAIKTRLAIDRISYFNFFLSPAIILLRLLGRLKPFKKVNSYDSKLNYDIAKKSLINDLLKIIFVTEIKLMKYISYPIGISIFTVLKKK
ncbi:MAG: Methyltransferase type 11 [Candidatus Collierbacteria bacterium GW2011_GWB1_44_6]|uniref:Methyltransferase type 11 n=2 Tax=Candidatus Collieribacteriota TaxID=1752725 RepID=A0A0G1MP13_9BACT|nr:MAG: Methyltransferase type 11 [Candidatus Collierbacteria bacterium GW2011_GWC2_43_12]KKT73749.1 MAG: Methyltransferase type 11 [Candidatus Collierbacteria bacterium GW2011_GWB1_44_6]